ncbi:hypothetical protein MSG28_010910 [Choristoneura fumiferana]|uniref:Uncharacterized protein n=1 Tax=Choristoneura fumiferana TaxID=7141 RepID=A0ACC0KPI4_CHOFU|nr:hypothetical protein MSG28_010910 [Choristoneura fumiferana]
MEYQLFPETSPDPLGALPYVIEPNMPKNVCEIPEKRGLTLLYCWAPTSSSVQEVGNFRDVGVPRNEAVLQLNIQGKIQGRRPPVRGCASWLRNLRDCFRMSTRSFFRAAVCKVRSLMIADLR